jgi:hypothetical protein
VFYVQGVGEIIIIIIMPNVYLNTIDLIDKHLAYNTRKEGEHIELCNKKVMLYIYVIIM